MSRPANPVRQRELRKFMNTLKREEISPTTTTTWNICEQNIEEFIEQ